MNYEPPNGCRHNLQLVFKSTHAVAEAICEFRKLLKVAWFIIEGMTFLLHQNCIFILAQICLRFQGKNNARATGNNTVSCET